MMLAVWCWWRVATAGELAGVTLPDQATVGGQTLVLNGMGLREKLLFDIYVAGLYLPARTQDAAAAIQQDVPKRLTMRFVYGRGVTKQQILDTFLEGFAKQGPIEAGLSDRLSALLEDMAPGEEITLDYVPGQGTTLISKGVTKGTLEGADFMRKLWTVYLGDHPPTAALKAGLLGG
jgi:hypothetical protein